MDYKIIFPVIFFTIFAGIIIMLFWKTTKFSEGLHKELDDIKSKAKQAFKEEELQSV